VTSVPGSIYNPNSRRIEELIASARSLAYQENYSYTEGWNDNVVVQALNFGLDRLYAKLTEIDMPTNTKEVLIDIVSGQAAYPLPIDVLNAIRLVDVRYLYAGPSVPWQFITLTHGMIQDRFSYPTTLPDTFTLSGGQIILSPAPSITNLQALDIFYQKRMRKLDIRRGAVSTVTITTPQIFNLTFPTTSQKFANMQANANNLLDMIDWCCIVDIQGNPLVDAIPLASYNQQTQVLTALSTYTIPAQALINLNAAIASTGAFVVQGDYSSTNSELDRVSEDYLIEYSILRLMRLSSDVEASTEQVNAEEAVLDRLLNQYRRNRPSNYPIIWQERLRPRSWPFGRRGMYSHLPLLYIAWDFVNTIMTAGWNLF
jgi:hypothetical protein